MKKIIQFKYYMGIANDEIDCAFDLLIFQKKLRQLILESFLNDSQVILKGRLETLRFFKIF